MTTITPLVGGDGITTANSMTKINTNFNNLDTDKIETSVIDTDTALSADSDDKIPSQKAVKAYIDTGGRTLKNCRVSQTSATTVASAGTFYTMDFGAESFDNDTMHSTVTNPSRITFTTAGKYCIGASVIMSTRTTSVAIQVLLNGTTIIADNGLAQQGSSVSTVYSFSAGDYVEFKITSLSNGVTTSGDTETNAWAFELG